MDKVDTLIEWNRLFISISLRLGKIYFDSADLDFSISKAHEEERWKWVDEVFVKDACLIYIWVLNHPKDKSTFLNCNFESISRFVKNPTSYTLVTGNVDCKYLRLYMGDDYNKAFSSLRHLC